MESADRWLSSLVHLVVYRRCVCLQTLAGVAMETGLLFLARQRRALYTAAISTFRASVLNVPCKAGIADWPPLLLCYWHDGPSSTGGKNFNAASEYLFLAESYAWERCDGIPVACVYWRRSGCWCFGVLACAHAALLYAI